MADDQPLLDTLFEMNAASVSRVGLEDRELMLVRLAALAAVGAPPASYLLNLAAAEEAGLTVEDAQAVLIGIAPVVGGPRVVAAAAGLTEALGFALALEEALEEGDLED